MGQAQAATDQQALAIDPVGLGQHLGDALGQALDPQRIAAHIEQQGEFVAAQAGDLIAGLQQALQARHHLQDQAITSLIAEGVVGVAEVVQIEMAEHQAATVAFGQARGEQGLETLTVGDAGQRPCSARRCRV